MARSTYGHERRQKIDFQLVVYDRFPLPQYDGVRACKGASLVIQICLTTQVFFRFPVASELLPPHLCLQFVPPIYAPIVGRSMENSPAFALNCLSHLLKFPLRI